MNPEIAALKQKVADLEYKLSQFMLIDRYRFTRNAEFKANAQFLGSKIGFFSHALVAKQTANTVPSGGGSSSSDAIDITGRAAIAQIRTTLNNLGLTA